jgi:hypothetical protein
MQLSIVPGESPVGLVDPASVAESIKITDLPCTDLQAEVVAIIGTNP